MPRGGAREGAGRKLSSMTVRHREVVEKALANGLTPLEVMLDNMRFYHNASVSLVEKLLAQGAPPLEVEPEGPPPDNPNQNVIDALREVLGFRKMAGEEAARAAPYIHPRLSAAVDDPENGKTEVPLSERLAAYQRRDDINAAGDKVVELKAGAK